MIKAVFMDYYGTVVHENGPITMEVVKRIYRNSTEGAPVPEGIRSVRNLAEIEL